MTSPALSATRASEAESLLAEGLARARRAHEGLEAGLRGLLGNLDRGLVSDRVVALVRSLIDDLAQQLAVDAGRSVPALAKDLIAEPAVLRHAHALALEDALAERLADQLSLDPVVSPLLQRLAQSDREASALLTVQAGFVQALRRGELAMGEWSAGSLRAVLAAAGGEGGQGEPANRSSLLDRVAAACGDQSLDLREAGAALFLTGLSQRTGMDRDAAVLLTSETDWARLALALRAAGLEPADVARQLFALHPDLSLPDGFAEIGADRAAALLAGPAGSAGA